MSLDAYRRKRRFGSTPEPAGKTSRKRRGPLFVVQKHKARRLHYDLRLEIDGVLKSWAVPKGPCLDPLEKRLAVHVEDHPLEYAQFEGVIPEGQYGAGSVLVWDRGRWEPEETDARTAYAEGKIKFRLEGEKLHGRWMLIKIKPRPDEPDQQWLLIKERDAAARPLDEYDVLIESQSVQSGRTIDEVARGGIPQPAGPLPKKRRAPRSARSAPKFDLESVAGAKRAELPATLKPQLAELADSPPAGDKWLHEIKFDGYRLMFWIDNGQVTIRTRRGNDWTEKFPHLAQAAAQLPVQTAILDGELVAMLPNGLSSFAALKNALSDGTVHRLVYFVFDLLYLDGYDLRKVPLEQRKALLSQVVPQSDKGRLQYVDHMLGNGPEFFEQTGRLGLEGIVSKRRDKPYRSDRSSEWLKSKHLQRDEFVIGGFTEPSGSRQGLGAILVGYFQDRKLHYAGRVGTGFTHHMLLDLRRRLDPLELRDNPFADLTRDKIEKGTHWVKPELVAQIEYAGWTDDRALWHPRFQGLREDLRAIDVVREPPQLDSTRAEPGADEPSRRARSNTTPAAALEKLSDEHAAQLAQVRITSPSRVLYEEPGLTKLDLVRYYVEIADWVLPHIVGRPLSLLRAPDGQGHGEFYQKHSVAGLPESIRPLTLRDDGEPEEVLVIDDLAGLVALVQFSVLEIHPWGARIDQPNRPDRLIFDLDPDENLPWNRVIEGAFSVRDLLADLGLSSFVKTSGGKGLHVVLPINRRHEWPSAKEFARAVARRLAEESPDRFTANIAKWARSGRIFVDYLRNRRGATAVAAYSTRARPGAAVSVPVEWDELPNILAPDQFSVLNVRERLASLDRDPWEDMGSLRQSLTADVFRRLGLKAPSRA
jgi:bifunctional non-homologous end joining protein LigD